jgi:hypothetical protein
MMHVLNPTTLLDNVLNARAKTLGAICSLRMRRLVVTIGIIIGTDRLYWKLATFMVLSETRSSISTHPPIRLKSR